MARTRRWTEKQLSRNIYEVKVSRWQSFYEFIQQELLIYDKYVWRGQSNPDWKLEPSFYRRLRESGQFLGYDDVKLALESHLEKFKHAVRGCNSGLSYEDGDEEWWAFGQHYGLATPLLDWTQSPFVAAYFSVREKPTSEFFSIWALSPSGLTDSNLIRVLHPMNDRNMRLQVQGGLFTMSRVEQNEISSILKTHNEQINVDSDRMLLIKFLIPSRERLDTLRALNRMNINHRSLFPDAYGAAKYANSVLEIKNY